MYRFSQNDVVEWCLLFRGELHLLEMVTVLSTGWNEPARFFGGRMKDDFTLSEVLFFELYELKGIR